MYADQLVCPIALRAHYSHDAERLQAVILRLEVLVSRLLALVAKHDVRDEVGVQVLDLLTRDLGVVLYLILEGGLALRIATGTTTSVALIGLVTIAVDVHVGEQFVVSVDEQDTGL
jgi:hypothetical protein